MKILAVTPEVETALKMIMDSALKQGGLVLYPHSRTILNALADTPESQVKEVTS